MTGLPKDKEIDDLMGQCQNEGMLTDDSKPFLLVISWGMLSVWLFFASLALAEQMNLTLETSEQDEHALSQLAAGLKPDVLHCEDLASGSVTAETSAPSSFVSSHQVTRDIVLTFPALRLHQRMSVYRI